MSSRIFRFWVADYRLRDTIRDRLWVGFLVFHWDSNSASPHPKVSCLEQCSLDLKHDSQERGLSWPKEERQRLNALPDNAGRHYPPDFLLQIESLESAFEDRFGRVSSVWYVIAAKDPGANLHSVRTDFSVQILGDDGPVDYRLTVIDSSLYSQRAIQLPICHKTESGELDWLESSTWNPIPDFGESVQQLCEKLTADRIAAQEAKETYKGEPTNVGKVAAVPPEKDNNESIKSTEPVALQAKTKHASVPGWAWVLLVIVVLGIGSYVSSKSEKAAADRAAAERAVQTAATERDAADRAAQKAASDRLAAERAAAESAAIAERAAVEKAAIDKVAAEKIADESAAAEKVASAKAAAERAEAEKRVSAPTMKIGDRATMETTYKNDYKLNNKTERRVVEVYSGRFVIESKNVRSSYTRRLEYTNEWNAISSRGAKGEGSDYSPPVKYWDFPLYPGKRWNETSTERNIKSGVTRQHYISGNVIGWENVTTAAGTFQAMKVVLNSEVRDPSGKVTSRAQDTSWYAPRVKRSVRSVIVARDLEKDTEEQQNIEVLDYSVN